MIGQQEDLRVRGRAMRFFGHPFYGIAVSIISIVGVLLSVYFYYEAKEAPELTFYAHPVRTSLVQAGRPTELAVSFRGKPIVGSVSGVQIAVWNEGKRPIRGEDILSPIVIAAPSGVEILEARIAKASRELIGFKLDQSQLSQGRLVINWRILERGDGAIVQVIYGGTPDLPIGMSGSILGQREPVALQFSGNLKSLEDQYSKGLNESRALNGMNAGLGVLAVLLGLVVLRRERVAKRNAAAVVAVALLLGVALLVTGVSVWTFLRSTPPAPPFGF